MIFIVSAPIGHVIGRLEPSPWWIAWLLVVFAIVAALSRRPRFNENMLILCGFLLMALSLWAENLNLVGSRNGDFGTEWEDSPVWHGIEHGSFGLWQLTGVIVGAVVIYGAVAMKTSRFAPLAKRYEKFIWLLPRLLAITAAVLVIAAATLRLHQCPAEDPHGGSHISKWPSGTEIPGCFYGGPGL